MRAPRSARAPNSSGAGRRVGAKAVPLLRREEDSGTASRRQWRRAGGSLALEYVPRSAPIHPVKERLVEMIAQALEWVFDNATSGSVELAESYRLKWAGDREQSIDDIIRSHTRYAAVVGFMTGVGGILSTPVAAPLNISSVIVIQVRLIAAIAHLRGYALSDPKVKALVFICLTGSGAAALVQELGFSVGKRIGARILAQGTQLTVKKFNAALARHLLLRYGARKAVVRGTPVIGGLVGGAIDAGVTLGIASTAKTVFKPVGARAYS